MGVQWDGKKYYESFDLDLLRARAYQWGVPGVIVKTMYNLWRAPRLVRLGTSFHPVALFAKSGLPAGDIFDDAFVKVYAIGAFDGFMSRW